MTGLRRISTFGGSFVRGSNKGGPNRSKREASDTGGGQNDSRLSTVNEADGGDGSVVAVKNADAAGVGGLA